MATKLDELGIMWRVKVLQIGVPDKANFVYNAAVVNRIVTRFIDDKSVCGQINFNKSGYIAMEDLSHVVKKLTIEQNCLFANIEIMTTNCGKLVKMLLLEDNDFFDFKLVGYGNYKTDLNSLNIVNTNFNLIGINAFDKNNKDTLVIKNE